MNRRLKSTVIFICVLFALLAIWRAVDMGDFDGLYGVADDTIDGWLHSKFDKQDTFTFTVDIIYTNEEPDTQNERDIITITERFDISVNRSGKTVSNTHHTFTVFADGSQDVSEPQLITVDTKSFTVDIDGTSSTELSQSTESLSKLFSSKINLWFALDRPIVHHTEGSITSADRVFPGEDIGELLTEITGDSFEPVAVVIKKYTDADASEKIEGIIESGSDTLFKSMYKLIYSEDYSNDLLEKGQYSVEMIVIIYR